MRRGMVRHGDPTTTGGFVLAFSGTMHDGGRKIALHGEEATCGHCKGLFKINGTGTHCTDNGRPTVLHGDLVLCPCGRNKVTAGGDPRCSVEDGGSSSIARSVSTGPVERNSSSAVLEDENLIVEQFFELADEYGRSIEDYRYDLFADATAVMTAGDFSSGKTLAQGGNSSLALVAWLNKTGEIKS